MGSQVRNRTPRALTALLLSAITLAPWASVNGQAPGGESIGGLQSNLPVIPSNSRRLLQGQEEAISGPGGQPVASFIDSLSQNDAAFSVVVGQSRILTLKEKIANPNTSSVIAIGDPSVADFQLMTNPKLIRVLGLRPGVTDFSVTTANDETVSLQLNVTYDLPLLQARLKQIFPAAHLQLAQLRDHLVVEGQARNPAQVAHIIDTLEAYLDSMQAESEQEGRADQLVSSTLPSGEETLPEPSAVELGGLESARARAAEARVINLIQVPGIKQVLLKVRIAEMNRTAMREIGADILGVDPSNGNIIGTQIGGATVSAAGLAGLGGLIGEASSELGNSSTAFGIFPSSDWQIIMRALRQNNLARVLAEPNLIAMSGHRANFLAGGEFPVPVPQASGGGSNSVTVDFREYGVRLDFLPYVVSEDRIRLSVTPEVSTIDESTGTTLVVGGDPVPGLFTRRANTTVELKPGQTLAMAGLMTIEIDGQTSRIPGLGDLPYIGPFFSNTTHQRQEMELLVAGYTASCSTLG